MEPKSIIFVAILVALLLVTAWRYWPRKKIESIELKEDTKKDITE